MKIQLSIRRRESGLIGIVIGIIVATVFGIIIYELYQLAKHIKPIQFNAPGETNDVAVYYTYAGNRAAGAKTPAWSQPAYLVEPDPVNQFTFQYKVMVDGNGVPDATLVIGTNLMDGVVTTLINNDAEYEITFQVGSQTYVEDYDAVTGDTINESITPPYAGGPCSVVVQRMTTYLWENIATNDPCTVGSIYTFSDSNPPSSHAVYRLQIQ